MTPDQAADLAARTLAAIDAEGHFLVADHLAADRERVASDLAGLQQHAPHDIEESSIGRQGCDDGCGDWPCADACRYTDDLRRTARLYGEEA